MKKKPPDTYDSVALGALAYEFPFSDKAEAEKKIKDRLRRKKLGRYDPERINRLRKLKDELQREIGKQEKSRYFTEHHRRYVDMSDFDIPRLTKTMIKKHSLIPSEEIESFVPFCVFIYHLL